MPEVDRVSFCRPSPAERPDWTPEEQLFSVLSQIQSERVWDEYEKQETDAQVTFVYKGE